MYYTGGDKIWMKRFFIFLAAVLLFGCNGPDKVDDSEKSGQISEKNIVLTINNQSFFNEDIINYAYYIIQEMDDNETENKAIKDKILNDFINHVLLLKEAEKAGVKVDRKKVKNVLEKFNKGFQNENINIFSGRVQPNLSQVEKVIYENMVVQKYLNKVIEENLKISEDDLKNYYDNLSINEEQKTLYLVWHIFTTDKQKADKARELLRQRNSFKKVAEDYSEDSYAEKGGDMGYVDIDVLPEVFRYVKKMRIRQVSPVIKSDYGYHIFSLRNISKTSSRVNFEEATGEIYPKVYEMKQKELIETLIKELRANAEIKIINYPDFTFKFDNSSKDN